MHASTSAWRIYRRIEELTFGHDGIAALPLQANSEVDIERPSLLAVIRHIGIAESDS
jgi:hypothetical protein